MSVSPKEPTPVEPQSQWALRRTMSADPRLEKPAWLFARWLAKAPCMIICISLFVIFMMIGIGSLIYPPLNSAPFWRVPDDLKTMNFDAKQDALIETIFPSVKDPNLVEPQRSVEFGDLALIYEAEQGDVFQVSTLRSICELEADIWANKDHKRLCLLDYSQNGTAFCVPPESVFRLVSSWDNTNIAEFVYKCSSLVEADVSEIKSAIVETTPLILNSTEIVDPRLKLASFFVNSLNGDPLTTGFEARFLRSAFRYGLPLKGYKNTDNPSKTMKGVPTLRASQPQVDEYTTSMVNEVFPLINDYDWGDSGIKTYTRAKWTDELIIDSILISDALLSGASVLFVFLYVWFHTRHFFLSVTGILGVLISFPVSLFFYAIFLPGAPFETLSFLGLFIILGIGADDIFIFVDAWKQAQMEPKLDTIEKKMGWTYRRAVKAMFVTSFTTAIAFAGNIVSVIPPIQRFGIFMGLLILSNYIIVITWFPACLSWAAQSRCCLGPGGCCCPRRGNRPEPTMGSGGTNKPEDVEMDVADASYEPSSGVKKTPGAEVRNPTEMRLFERFFYGPYASFFERVITGSFKFKHVVVIFGAILFGIAAYGFSELDPDDEVAKFLPDDHPFQKFVFIARDDFQMPSSYGGAQGGLPPVQAVEFVWGIAGYDIDAKDEDDPDDNGAPIFAEPSEFDLAKPKVQTWLNDLCVDVIWSEDQADWVDLSNPSGTSGCFMQDFKTWLNSNCSYSGPTSIPVVPQYDIVSGPYGYQSCSVLALEGPSPSLSKCVGQLPGGGCPGEVFPVTDKAHFYSLLSTFRNTYGMSFTGPKYFQSLGFESRNLTNGGDLKFATIKFDIKLTAFQPATAVSPHYEHWEQVIAENPSPDGAAVYYQTNFFWVQMEVEEVLVQTAFICAVASVAVAFILITATSGNILIGALASLSIIGVVLSCGATMTLYGWKLGVIESVSLTVLVGVSVDYIVHLAVAFNNCHHDGRFERMRYALYEMGISVVSAAITTAGSSVVLWACTIVIFVKFGFFLFTTIVLSCLWSFVIFTAIMMTVGPQGTFGNFWQLCRRKS